MLNYISPREVPVQAGKRNGKWIRQIREFVDSGARAAEFVVTDEGLINAYNGLTQANKRLGKPVIVVMRKYRVFLLKKEGENNA